MTVARQHQLRTLGMAPAACITVALFLVLLVGGWGAYRDMAAIHQGVLQAAISQTRSHAERSVGRVESQLVDEGFGTDLSAAAKAQWLKDYWKRTIPQSHERLYGAVLSPDGRILSHSDPQQVGKRLEPGWDREPMEAFGLGTYATQSAVLGGVSAIDIAIPITFRNQTVGMYHTGLDRRWLDEQVAIARSRTARGWLIVIGIILLVVLLSSLSLYRITRHTALLETALELSDARRIGEVSQLVVGMAHEVRNPLNAVRLNLFTAERVFRGDAHLESDELTNMLGESVREIERIDSLIQQLLGYARPEPQQVEVFDVVGEVRSALAFLKHVLDQAAIAVEIHPSGDPLFICMDRGRFRQVFLNLMNNAREAVGENGKITIRLAQAGDYVELSVSDNGPGVPGHLRERIFEPFFSTKDSGTGLGLAVVRNLVEIAGGVIRYDGQSSSHGSCFSVALPRVTPKSGEAI